MEMFIPNPIGGGADEPEGDDPNARGDDPNAGGDDPSGQDPNQGKNDGQPPAGSPSSDPNTQGGDVDPAVKNLIDQHGNDINKLAKKAQSTDAEYGKLREGSINSFVEIVKNNPEAIHTAPEGIRDAVVKSVYGNVGVNSYEELKSRAGADDIKDPVEEAKQNDYIQRQFDQFAGQMDLLPSDKDTSKQLEEKENKRKSLFTSLVPSATNLLSSRSPLLGDDLRLNNALRVAFTSSPEGQEHLKRLGYAEGLQRQMGRNAGNIDFSGAKPSADDVTKARREAMRDKMRGPRPIKNG